MAKSPGGQVDATRPGGLGLALLVLLALALRLGHAALVPSDPQAPGLSRKYQAVASHVLRGEGFWQQVGEAPVPFCDRLPGYVLVLAAVMAVTAGSAVALAAGHAAIGSLQAAVAALLAARLGGRRAGLLAGLLVAAWPPLWRSDVQVLETGTCGLVNLLVVHLLVLCRERATVARTALLAVASTLAFTLRPDAQVVPILAAGLLLSEARRPRAAVAVLLAPLLVAVPWALRNSRVADGAFVSVGLGANLLGALGESVDAGRPLLGDREVARSEGHESLFWPDPLRRDRERVRLGLQLVREHPAAYLRGCARRVVVSLGLYQGRLWPGPLPEEHLAAWRAAHPGQPRYEGMLRAGLDWLGSHPVLAVLTLAWGPLLLVLAALGAWRLRGRSSDLRLLLALPVVGLLVHVPLHAEPRYFMPFVPLLLVLGALGLGLRRVGHDEASQPARAA